MEKIFHFCLDRQERHYQRRVFAAGCVYLRLTPYPEWLQITRVCSRWRRVALGYSRLWSTIACDSRKWFDLCIERLPPKQVIDVALRLSGDQVDQTTISSQIGRIRTLDIEVHSCYEMRVFLDGLTGPAPALEKMSLSTMGNVLDRSVVVPTTFIKSAYRLTELTLGDGVWIEGGPYTLADLTHLRVKSSVTIPKLQSLLQRVPHLRSANIEKIDEYPSRVDPDSIATVTLPDLQTLLATFSSDYFTGDPSALHLIPILYLPSLACMHLVIYLDNTSAEALDRMTTAMLRFLRQPNALPRSIRSIVLFCGDKLLKQMLQCFSWPEGGRTTHLPPEDLLGPVQSQSPFSFSYAWRHSRRHPETSKLYQSLDSIIRFMPLADVQTLTLGLSNCEFPVSCWLSALRTLSQVEEVTVYEHHDLSNFLRAATPPIGGRSGESLFPRLKTLVIKLAKMARRGGPLAHAIYSFIEGRGLANLQLEQLDFQTSNSFSCRLNRRLYGKVNVTWNGKKIVPYKLNGPRAVADSTYDGGWMDLDEGSQE